MARYFLHIHSGDGFQPDEVGQDYATADLAVAEAAATAGEIIRDEVTRALEDRQLNIVVEDEAKTKLAEVELKVRIHAG